MSQPSAPQPRFLLPIAALFTGALIVSNIVAVKIADFSDFSGPVSDYFLPAAVIVFPISYIFGDILTEVYGYRTARRVIWSAFLANGLAVLAIVLADEFHHLARRACGGRRGCAPRGSSPRAGSACGRRRRAPRGAGPG